MGSALRDRQTFSFYFSTDRALFSISEDLVICPNCKMDVGKETIVREKIGSGIWKEGDIHKTIFFLPSCHVVLGIAQ